MRRAPWDGVILALDLATTIGFTIGHSSCEEPSWGTHKLPSGGSDAQAAIALAGWLRPLLDKGHVGLVAKETAPSIIAFKGATNARTLQRLISLGNKAEEVCLELGIECADVDLTQWRKALTGRARFGKSERPYPPIAALAQIGFEVPDHNAADSFGVWLYALAVRNVDASLKFHPLARRSARRMRA